MVKKIIVGTVLIALYASLSLAKTIGVAALYGASMTNQEYTSTYFPGLSTSSASYTSYGILANIVPLSWGVSLGLFYTELGSQRQFISGIASVSQNEKIPYYQAVATLDYWFFSILALGAGVYYGASAGNVYQSDTYTALGENETNSRSLSFSEIGYKPSDYGLVLHAQVTMPLSGKVYVTGNLLYEQGLYDISNSPGVSARNSALLLHGGIGIGL